MGFHTLIFWSRSIGQLGVLLFQIQVFLENFDLRLFITAKRVVGLEMSVIG